MCEGALPLVLGPRCCHTQQSTSLVPSDLNNPHNYRVMGQTAQLTFPFYCYVTVASLLPVSVLYVCTYITRTLSFLFCLIFFISFYITIWLKSYSYLLHCLQSHAGAGHSLKSALELYCGITVSSFSYATGHTSWWHVSLRSSVGYY